MRKITQKVVGAFMRGESATLRNTKTDGKSLWLHGHRIAWHSEHGIALDHCGWKTMTTKERLNGIPGVFITQKAYDWYVNGKLWESSPFIVPQV